MAMRDDLHRLIDALPEQGLPKVLAFLRGLQGSQTPPAPKMDAESKAWLDDSAAEMLEALRAIEADVPKEELEAWHKAMMANAVPVRFDQTTGEVVQADECA